MEDENEEEKKTTLQKRDAEEAEERTSLIGCFPIGRLNLSRLCGDWLEKPAENPCLNRDCELQKTKENGDWVQIGELK